MSETSKPHSELLAMLRGALTDIRDCDQNDCDQCYDDAGVGLNALAGIEEQLEAAQHEAKRLAVALDATVARAEGWENAVTEREKFLQEQLEATQRALLAFFAEFDDPDDKVSFYAPTGDTEALMRAALNPASEPKP